MKGISNRGGCKCKQHEFILKPLVKDVHFSRKVTVSMCQCDKIREKKKMLKIRKQSSSAYPVFNRDGNHATPAFILPMEKQHFEQNRQIYLKDHTRKVKQIQEISENLYFPAPRSNYVYCNVCCCPYENYNDHIASESHHKHIKRSKFNSYILEIEEKFNPEGQNDGSLKRSATSRIIDIEEESSSGIFGYKKVKTESRTELPSENHLQLLMRENFIKEYQNFCQLNNLLLLQRQKQQNIMENSIKNYEMKKYSFVDQKEVNNGSLPYDYKFFYNQQQPQVCGQPTFMEGYQQNPFMIGQQNFQWQNMCYLMMQNNLYHQYQRQQQQMELHFQNQQLCYFPSYIQSISAAIQ